MSSGVPLIALEIVLGFVAPLAWAAWELFDLRREREADRRKAERAGGEATAATTGGAASGTAAVPAPTGRESGPG